MLEFEYSVAYKIHPLVNQTEFSTSVLGFPGQNNSISKCTKNPVMFSHNAFHQINKE